MHLYWSIHSSLSALPGHGNGPQCSPSHFGHIMDAIKLSQVSLSVNSALRQEIVEALYEHGLLVFRNQAHLIPQDEIAFAQLCPRQLDDKNVSYKGGARIQYPLFPTIPQLSLWVLTLAKFVITVASHNFGS